MKVFENHFQTFDFDNTNCLLTHSWFDTTQMEAEDFKTELMLYTKQIEQFNPQFVLSDARNFVFAIPVELHEWVANNQYINRISQTVEKLAIIISPSIFAQVSLEQAIEDTKNQFTQTRYFENKEEATEWLLCSNKINQ